MKREYISTEELSAKTGIAAQTIRNNTYRIEGRVKAGGRVIYRVADIEKALQRGKLF